MGNALLQKKLSSRATLVGYDTTVDGNYDDE